MVYAACSRRRKSLIQKDLRVEPVVGFELTTDGLQNRCSTTELNWLIWTREWESNPRISFCRAAPYHLAIPRIINSTKRCNPRPCPSLRWSRPTPRQLSHTSLRRRPLGCRLSSCGSQHDPQTCSCPSQTSKRLYPEKANLSTFF